MRIFLLFVLLLLVSLFLGALANYPLYMLLQDITNPRPERLINVAAKLIAIPGFILIIRHYAIYSKQGLGYGLPPSACSGMLFSLLAIADYVSAFLTTAGRGPTLKLKVLHSIYGVG